MENITKAVTRASAVLGAVPTDKWASTTTIGLTLDDRGFSWSFDTIRGVLNHLRDSGTVLRRMVGRTYEWRVASNHAAQAEWRVAGGEDYAARPKGNVAVRPAVEILDELRAAIDAAQVPADYVHTQVFIGDGAALGTLVTASHDLTTRVIARAQAVALREVLTVLDGYIEGMQENHEAMGHRDSDCCSTFAADDVRNMLDEAARTFAVPLPLRGEGRDDATS